MKAIVATKYGPPDVLELKEVGKPTPRENEALVRIHAASLNAADLEMLRGTWSARFGGPLKPRLAILGSDIAGRIEAVGRSVKQFQPGDEIWVSLTALVFTRHDRRVFTTRDRPMFTSDDRPVFATRDRLVFTIGAVRLHSPPTHAGRRSKSGATTYELSA
jgi:hypothetical protein